MFADQTLTPKEAMRLCALGTVADAPMAYGALAAAVRQFCGRVMGPSLELVGLSIELLRAEGLVEGKDGRGISGDDVPMTITEVGRRELIGLLTARVRPSSDFSKLVVALKFRFLHLLDGNQRAAQIEMLRDACESESARLESLRAEADIAGTALAIWLDHDLELLRQRITWLEAFAAARSDASGLIGRP